MIRQFVLFGRLIMHIVSLEHWRWEERVIYLSTLGVLSFFYNQVADR